MIRFLAIGLSFMTILAGPMLRAADKQVADDLFRPANLVAWCIVPFDAKKRGPEERAAMLEKLGVRRLAYDYRAEHIPTFDAEIEALQRHGIELTAWWFPSEMNDEARLILDVLRRHKIGTQLWVTGGGEPTTTPEEHRQRVIAEAKRLRPIAEAAAAIGCSVGLYNHGGWFGEPENQIAIIQELSLTNVGIVYNFHHGHDHVARFPELLAAMKPHLLAINLNGMVANGDQRGQKILPLGAGDQELNLVKVIVESGYDGPIGILNHTDEDAEGRLLDNLDGLRWLQQQLNGEPNAARPSYRTWRPPPEPALQGGRVLPGGDRFRQPPITIECRASLVRHDVYNILVACDTKESRSHWELFTEAGSGELTAFFPGSTPDHVRSQVEVCDGRPRDFAMTYEPHRVQLFIDGRCVADQAIEPRGGGLVPGNLAIGRLVEGTFHCFGTIESVRISRGIVPLPRPSADDPNNDSNTLGYWQFSGDGSSTVSEPLDASTSTGPAALPAEPNANMVSQLVEQAVKSGDAQRGLAWFTTPTTACLSCHRVGDYGGAVGPALTQVGKDRKPEEIVESILWPKHKVAPEYSQWMVTTTDGDVHRGYRTITAEGAVQLRDVSHGTEQLIDSDEIEEQVEMGTLMPDGLLAVLPVERQADLIRFLIGLGTDRDIPHEELKHALSRVHQHAPEIVQFDRRPLMPSNWPNWQHPINRDRLYDWYAKQADHFLKQANVPRLLGEFPGLDGGEQGHWGNQNEEVWADGRWNQVDLGNLLAGVFHGPNMTIPRGVCVRVGPQHEFSACFNPETLNYDAVWTGGFVKFSPVRHGFLNGLEMVGQLVERSRADQRPNQQRPNQRPPDQSFQYHGYYRFGEQVVFSYRKRDVEYLDAPTVKDGQFHPWVAPRDEHPLRKALAGGPALWPEQISTSITPGSERPYAVDTIELPASNPWNTLFFCGDHDFLADGSALVCTMHGDVWRVSGLEEGTVAPGVARWRRVASGLHHPLGLIVDGPHVYVQCRDQLTRLHDLNGDGEYDFYECFSSDFVTSPAGHDFICGLQRDAAGNFYIASGNQGLIRISADGRTTDVVASGFRNPDGLGIMSDGTITVPCSEGEWTPASMICAVRPAALQPQSPLHFGYGGPKSEQGPELPLVYLPRGLDNSAGGQVLVTSDRWGPVRGAMVHLSFGTGSHFLLLTDEVRGRLQGAVVPLVGDFRSGVHRGRFSPRDGQLYVSGMAGWGTYTPDDGCFQRVRYTGAPVDLPVDFHIHENGIVLTFATSRSADVVANATHHFAQCWNYRYSRAYGSAEYSPSQFGVRGHDVLSITRAHLFDGGRKLFLEIPDLQRTNQLHLRVRCSESSSHDLFATVHELDEPFTEYAGYVARAKEIFPHPMQLDLKLATKVLPNPWRESIRGEREIRIETDKNLTYATREFRVQAGEAVRLVLVNTDVVPHNWALVRPHALERVGLLANRLISDPEAATNHYVPASNDVLAYTDIVYPQSEFAISFRAPTEAGKYPYLCTFPGHWMVMNGTMVVE